MCLVVRAWLILVGSNWNWDTWSILRLYCGERVPSKGWFPFWVLYPDFLSHYCSASSCNHYYPWILRAWLGCSVCLLSALLYLYRNESAWKAIPGYPLKDDECLELYYIIYDLKQFPRTYYFLCQEMYTQIGLAQSWTDECYLILVKSDVKSVYKVPVINDLTELNEHLAVEIPPSAQVLPIWSTCYCDSDCGHVCRQ
jgi:hypothetical protein